MNVLYLILSVIFSTARNILSKEISDSSFGTKNFFLTQAVIFISGGIMLAVLFGNCYESIALLTVIFAIIYGTLLLSAQYCYTSALKKGNVGVCSTVYSLGFIFPTLSGAIFWDEALITCNIVGIMLVIPTIIISGIGKINSNKIISEYIFPLLLAMLSSGGLGILQKIQQNSSYSEQKGIFLIIAFTFAGIVSFVFALLKKKETTKCLKKDLACAMGIGAAFGLANLLNTILAGVLDSAVFFPILNISTILFSLISGVIIYKEKLLKKDVVVLILASISIFLVTRT